VLGMRGRERGMRGRIPVGRRDQDRKAGSGGGVGGTHGCWALGASENPTWLLGGGGCAHGGGGSGSEACGDARMDGT
jgi:hypothetical protein